MEQGALGKLYEDGEVIIRQNEVGSCMYVIQEGRAEIILENEEKDIQIAIRKEGDFFGEMALFDRDVRSATVRALGPCRILTVDKKNLLSRIHQDPSLAFRLLEDMSGRIRELDAEIYRLIDLIPTDDRSTSNSRHLKGYKIESRVRRLMLPPEIVFQAFSGIGGDRGWMYMDWAWVVRGWMDELIGGVGLRRGRRHPDEIEAGETLDFWRVVEIIPDRSMLLHAEMITPGEAWLEFRSEPIKDGQTVLSLRAYFQPHGFWGWLYWYSLFPIHKFIFDGMIRNLGNRAYEIAAEPVNVD